MPRIPKDLLKRCSLPLLALGLGLLLGGLLGRSSARGVREGDTAEPESHESVRPAHPGDASSRTKARTASLDQKTIRFSRSQWSKLVRQPRDFAIGLAGILPVLGPGELPEAHPSINRIFLGDPHPDLRELGQLFGWDPSVREKVRRSLTDFGRALTDAEKSAARIEYPEPGRIRFDFSEASAARETAAKQLEQQLLGLLGEKDAARFTAITNLEGPSTGFNDHYDITATYDGNELRILAPGVMESVEVHDSIGPENFDRSIIEGNFDARILHLTGRVDWSRLNPVGP